MARDRRGHDRIRLEEAPRECDCGKVLRPASPPRSDCEQPSRGELRVNERCVGRPLASSPLDGGRERASERSKVWQSHLKSERRTAPIRLRVNNSEGGLKCSPRWSYATLNVLIYTYVAGEGVFPRSKYPGPDSNRHGLSAKGF